MRRNVALLIATCLVFVGLGATAASADQPTEFSFPDTFTDINPCGGPDQEITINLEFTEHQQHNRNFVGHVKRTGTTDSGYVMDHGVESFQLNGNVVRGAFTDIWRNDDDGSMFKAQGVFVFNFGTGELLVDRFSLLCIGN